LQSPGKSKASRPSTALRPLPGRGLWRCLNSTSLQPAAALEHPMSTVTLFEISPRRLREGGGADPCCADRRGLLSRARDRRGANRKRNQPAYRLCVAWLLAGGIGLLGVTRAAGEPTCKPTLTFTKVQFSEMQPPTLERRWTAIVSVDASRCTTTAGYFEVGFSRLKETGMELKFREQFVWSPPAVTVGVDFWADEAVESYWVDSVQACPCAR